MSAAVLGELCRTTSGGTPSRRRPDYFEGSIPWVKSGELTDGPVSEVEEFITEEAVANSSAKVFPAGTLLIALYGATVGKLGILTRAAATNQAVCAIFPPSELDTKFLFWNLRSRRSDLIAQAIGGAQPNISQGILRSLEIYVPPVATQRSVVAEIEKQFSRLDEAVASLKRVKSNLKRYKAAILKAAVEGRLVPTEADLARREGRDYEPGAQLLQRILDTRRSQWQGKGNYKEPPATDTTDLPELPEGWVWATVEQLSLLVEYGSSAKTSQDSSGIPVIRMGNILEGELVLGDLKYLPKEHGEFPKLLLKAGDLLFNRTNSPELVGKTAVFAGASQPYSFASYLIRVRLVDGCLPVYLNAFINSVYGRAWVKTVVTQQVGQANVNGTKLQALSVPLPPPAEQHRIVAEVEHLLSIAREAEAEVETNVKRGASLRAAILSKSFGWSSDGLD